MLEFSPSRISVELPVNLAVSIVAIIRPSANLISDRLQLVNTAIKTLTLHGTKLNLSYVKPMHTPNLRVLSK